MVTNEQRRATTPNPAANGGTIQADLHETVDGKTNGITEVDLSPLDHHHTGFERSQT